MDRRAAPDLFTGLFTLTIASRRRAMLVVGGYRQLAEMHQNLLRKFDRESKAMKRLSMNNDELMWKLSQSDVGQLSDDDDRGGASDRATARREAAGGMFMSATLPSRGGRGPSSTPRAAMSRSYDSPRAMFGASTASATRQKAAAKSTATTNVPVRTDSDRLSSASAPDAANSRLRRSGTYDVVDDN